MIPNISDIPYTGGRGYTYIDQQTYETMFAEREDSLNLNVDDHVILYRVARDADSGELVFLKLQVIILEINDEAMVFCYNLENRLAYKVMRLDGYGLDWCYIRVN